MKMITRLPIPRPGLVAEAELPSVARPVLAGIWAGKEPSVWLEVEDGAPLVRRSFTAMLSGQTIPDHYRHFASLMLGPADLHLYEVVGTGIVVVQ